MSDKQEGRKLLPNEKAFLLDLASSAQRNGLSPRQTLPLFGRLARVAAHAEHAQGRIDLDEALAEAMHLILAGMGVKQPEAALDPPSTNMGLH